MKIESEDNIPTGGMIAAEGMAVDTRIGTVIVSLQPGFAHLVELPVSRHMSDVRDFLGLLNDGGHTTHVSRESTDTTTRIYTEGRNLDEVVALVNKQFGTSR